MHAGSCMPYEYCNLQLPAIYPIFQGVIYNSFGDRGEKEGESCMPLALGGSGGDNRRGNGKTKA